MGRLEKFGRRFSLGQTINMGRIGHIIGQWTSLPSIHGKLILLTKIFPQKHQDLNLGLITLDVTGWVWKMLTKVGLDWGLNAWELGRCLCDPTLCIKSPLVWTTLIFRGYVDIHSGKSSKTIPSTLFNPKWAKLWCFH